MKSIRKLDGAPTREREARENKKKEGKNKKNIKRANKSYEKTSRPALALMKRAKTEPE